MTANKAPRPATIKAVPSRGNGYYYKVVTDDDETFYLRGIGTPQGGKVGDRGLVTYETGASFGLYFWAKKEAP